ncbi:MAG TPA: hypothetical protein PKV73_12085 [Agriterribacter sp.]|nr:hypothetical protein [Agriterribacter sp.]
MRKIDVVLLSALILYDYSAQSLVDRDVINLGNTFISDFSGTHNNKKVAPVLQDENSSMEMRQISESNPEKFEIAAAQTTEANSISYYALAKINTASAVQEDHSQTTSDIALEISTPSPFSEENALAPEQTEWEADDQNLNLSLATLTVSSSANSLSTMENVEVKDESTEDGLKFADSDNDEMFDFEDKCPSVAGVARFEGCPVPDSDADGINDEDDRCPFEAGSADGSGCPSENLISTTYQIPARDNTAIDTRSLLTVVQFEEKSDVLSTNDFNSVLKLADMVLNGSVASIELFKSSDSQSQKEVNNVIRYLTDLGVNHSQINVSEKAAANPLIGGVELKLKY